MAKGKKYYDDFFLKFGAKVHDDPVRFIKIANLCKGKVGDFGCGTGTLADFYDGEYYGYDISSVAVKFAKNTRRESAKFESGDLLAPRFQTLSNFDTIVLAEFLEHIEDDKEIFRKISKVLKPGGRIIISVPNGDRVPDESHFRSFTVPQLRQRFSKLGKVKFYNYPGFQERILMTIDLGQKSETSLSLAIIAKNEGKGLENAILSCIDFVDSIAIGADDSSKDDTLTIAKRYGDVCISYKWRDDFSWARNNLQKEIKTDWVLWLDGHEYIKERVDLSKCLKKNYDSYFIKNTWENGFSFWFPRLVRKEVRWKEPIHNHPVVERSAKLSGLGLWHDRVGLQAKEAFSIRDKQRTEMIFSIMTKQIKENKKNKRPYFYIGNQYFYQKNFKKAIKFYKNYLKYSNHKGERWLVCYQIATARIFLNQKLRALWALAAADKEIPGRWEIEKTRGIVWSLIGNHKKAVEHYIQSFPKQTGDFTYCPLQKDDAHTWDFIGHSLFALGKIGEAKIAWNRSLELEKAKPKKDRNKQRLKILERMLKY